MTRSVHDNLLVSYEVECEARTISLRTEKRLEGNPIERTYVRFVGVEGYRFMNDAFGNIISGLEELSLEQFFSDYGCEIAGSYRVAGSPGPWAANLGEAVSVLRDMAIQAFILSSSFGLAGWVLAKEVAVILAQQVAPADGCAAAGPNRVCRAWHSTGQVKVLIPGVRRAEG